jgi:hypothetical protein
MFTNNYPWEHNQVRLLVHILQNLFFVITRQLVRTKSEMLFQLNWLIVLITYIDSICG